MKISEFFDPWDVEHLKAYRYLEKTGRWPDGFLPADIECPSGWEFWVRDKIIQCWLDEMGILL